MIIFVIYLKMWNIFPEFLGVPKKTPKISRDICLIERITDYPKDKVTNNLNVKQAEADNLSSFFFIYSIFSIRRG